MAFHPYPHLIPWFFNTSGFGPPAGITLPSPWTWVAHPVSGRRRCTQRPVQTRFRCGSGLFALTSHTIVTRRFILQKARRHGSSPLRLLVGTRFQVLFHSPPGVLFTFPSRYWFTIGRQGVFSLGRWSSRIPTGFPVPRGTQGPSRRDAGFGYRAFTVYGGPFQTTSPTGILYHSVWDALQPRRASARRFGLFPVRSPLLRESRLLSSPQGTKMFQFPWCAPVHPMDSGGGTGPRQTGGLPHSGIPGSTLAYSSPRLIGVRPALHRLLAPRHPPCALTSFSSTLSGDALIPYPIFKVRREMVGLSGFEPLTSRLSGVRSDQLSYRPKQHSLKTEERRSDPTRFIGSGLEVPVSCARLPPGACFSVERR